MNSPLTVRPSSSPPPTSPGAAAYTAFAGDRRAASGSLRHVAEALKALVEDQPQTQILVFDDISGAQVDMNLHGSLEDVLQRLPNPRAPIPTVADGAVTRSVGRPKLGVVAREVTLLPRHWDWLAGQPGGASVALRKLVEHAQRDSRELDQKRAAREASYKFMNAMAGDRSGFEEAMRALFAGNREQFEMNIQSWPADVREHAWKMAKDSF
ncbi:MAG TPA: DUF2239 family protein [Janthinobacterium sp.]|nr:DUF2239 family protein [Janthinobacterium sp.]